MPVDVEILILPDGSRVCRVFRGNRPDISPVLSRFI
jgi:hypothetical protein